MKPAKPGRRPAREIYQARMAALGVEGSALASHPVIDRGKLYRTLHCEQCQAERKHIYCTALGQSYMCYACTQCGCERDPIRPGWKKPGPGRGHRKNTDV